MSSYGNNLNRSRACKLKYEGMVFKTNSFGDVKILVYENSKSVEKDIEYWNMVKTWVKKYYQESF